MIWITKTIEPVIVERQIGHSKGPVKLLQIKCLIDGHETLLSGDKKELIKLKNIIKIHFENQKLELKSK